MKKKNKQFGSTLLEILVYFGILGIVLLVAMSFAIQILNVNKLSGNSFELQTNMNFITAKIVQKVHMAQSVNLNESIFDTDTGALSLNLSDVTKSPTNFYWENNNIYFKEAANQPIKLNSDLMKISKLRFHRITSSKSPDQIIFDIEVMPKNAEIANINKTMNIHLSVNLRYL